MKSNTDESKIGKFNVWNLPNFDVIQPTVRRCDRGLVFSVIRAVVPIHEPNHANVLLSSENRSNASSRFHNLSETEWNERESSHGHEARKLFGTEKPVSRTRDGFRRGKTKTPSSPAHDDRSVGRFGFPSAATVSRRSRLVTTDEHALTRAYTMRVR